MTGGKPGLASRGLIGLVRVYQAVVSPWFAPRCRYYPSCSNYAVDALRKQGLIRGFGLAVWRVLPVSRSEHAASTLSAMM